RCSRGDLHLRGRRPRRGGDDGGRGMSDRYQQLINTPVGRIVSKQIGLPQPIQLERYEPGQPVIDGPVLFGATERARLAAAVSRVLRTIDADAHTPFGENVRNAAADAGLEASIFNADVAPSNQTFKAPVFDASGIDSSERLRAAYEFFH